MELPNGSSDHNHDGEHDCYCCGSSQNYLQSISTMEQAGWRCVLQFLGSLPSLPLCKGTHGKKREGSNHCLCLVWITLYYHIIALGVHKPTFRSSTKLHEFPVPLVFFLRKKMKFSSTPSFFALCQSYMS
ncbi:hypothetical protein HN51_039302 [Arachis hypogaea]